MKSNTTQLTTCAIFAALSAVLSQVSIPIGLVPINFTHASIFIAAGLLGKKYGTISQIIFILLGAIGLPVFSGFKGGIGVILGPTGGLILGYIACAFVTGLIIERFGTSMKILIFAMYSGWVVTYAIGIPWYMYVTKTNSIMAALAVCFFPFLLGDLLKTILSAVLVKRLKPILHSRLEI